MTSQRPHPLICDTKSFCTFSWRTEHQISAPLTLALALLSTALLASTHSSQAVPRALIFGSSTPSRLS
jgi:hypothetical protein